MTNRMKSHLDSLFEGAPETRQIQEMREELLAGCLDKYEDLTAGGREPESAFQEVVAGIGDVDELLGQIEQSGIFDLAETEAKRKKRAFFISVGICCFFIGLALIPFLDAFAFSGANVGAFLLFAGIGTVLIVYGNMTYSTKYEKRTDTMVEEMKVQMVQGRREDRLAQLASGSLWCVLVMLYFLISFLTGGWALTWILFLLGAALQCLITAYFYPGLRHRSVVGAYWCAVTALYFLISFLFAAWTFSWMLFLLAAAGQLAAQFYIAWREEA